MPNVGGKKFSYDAPGIEAANKARKEAKKKKEKKVKKGEKVKKGKKKAKPKRKRPF